MTCVDDAAEAVVRSLRKADLTVATAESLTGGLVCAALTCVPGASAVVRGGVVLYTTAAKADLGGVATDLLHAQGPVSAEVASAMADGVRRRFDAQLGIATTGVAGPDLQDGHPVGTVHVALASASGLMLRSYVDADRLTGSRVDIRGATVAAALDLLGAYVSATPGDPKSAS